jgi:hypothetical protein
VGELTQVPRGWVGREGGRWQKKKGGKENPKSNATGGRFDPGPKSFNARLGTWVKFLFFSPKVVSSSTRTTERTNERKMDERTIVVVR